ncbi:putative DNA binding protein [Bacillus phage vB_BspM_MarvelLand]|nr:putative DNA binding protein [Bacillus phage vB_BspM_MarvelLand]
MAKEFKWDTEVQIGEVKVSDKVRHDIIHCTLKGQAYIAIVEWKLGNEGWKRSKNRTVKLDVFEAAAAILNEITEEDAEDIYNVLDPSFVPIVKEL